MHAIKRPISLFSVSLLAIGCSCNSESTPTPSTPETRVDVQAKPVDQVALPAGVADQPVLRWSEELFEGSEPLSNVPVITHVSTVGNVVRVTAKNTGTTTLQYFSTGTGYIQLFQEIKENGEWTPYKWDWCGTGKEDFDIDSNESVELVVKFWDADKQERMLANFSEKETNRCGLVVLASESGD